MTSSSSSSSATTSSTTTATVTSHSATTTSILREEEVAFLPSTRAKLLSTSSTTSTSTSRFNYVCETMLLEGPPPVDPPPPPPPAPMSRRSTGSSISSIHHPPGTSSMIPGGYYTRNSSISRISLASSLNEIMSTLPLRTSSFTTRHHDIRGLPKSSRHSFGKEWTKNHWDKIKQLEQSSSQARRCSKLSSGFAPLMIFGGLVFVCIGVSANFNSQSKDHEKLQRLSVAPLAMGSFMLMLGTVLLCTWFGCRARARGIDQKVLHGSMEFLNDKDESLLHAIFTKIYGYTNHGLDHQDAVFAPQVVVDRYSSSDTDKSETTGQQPACTRCNPSPQVVREMSS